MTSRVLPFLALLIAAGIIFGYIQPAYSGSITANNAAIKADNQALAAAADYKLKENELASKKNSIDPADLIRVTTLIPDSVNNVQLVLDLNALAARSNITLSNIDVKGGASATDDPSAQGPVGSVDLTLSAAGTYPAFRTFLAGIERSARLLDIQQLAIGGSDNGVYSYQMSIRLYWLR